MRTDIEETNGFYQIDDEGRFWSMRTGKEVCKNGLAQFTLKGGVKISTTKNSMYKKYAPHLCNVKRELSKTERNIYGRLTHIISRCYNINDKQYKNYGGRGIKVFDGWLANRYSFTEYCITIGYDKSLSIDRIDNDKGYEPDNIRFVDSVTQNNNMRSNIIVIDNGEKLTLSIFCRKYDLKYKSVHSKLVNKYNKDTAAMYDDFKKGKLFSPHQIEVEVEGVFLSIRQISEKYNLPYEIVRSRYKRHDRGDRLIRPKKDRK